MRKLIGLLILTLCIASCATKDEIVYFDNVHTLEGNKNVLEYEPKIQVNDVLRINVSSSSIKDEIVQPFNMQMDAQQGGGSQNQSLTGYLVSSKGTIQFPVLGTILVKGFTRSEIQEMLENEIQVYVKDPIVDVRIVNFNVTVLGEVGNPGRISVNDGRVSMPELIAMAGEITYNGKRENIIVIREIDGVKTVGRIDMTETGLFDSPYFYLKQNDIVYVEPTYRRVKSAGFFSSPGSILSLVSSVLSLILIFTR